MTLEFSRSKFILGFNREVEIPPPCYCLGDFVLNEDEYYDWLAESSVNQETPEDWTQQ